MSKLSSPSRDEIFIIAVKQNKQIKTNKQKQLLNEAPVGVDNSNNALHVERERKNSPSLHLSVPKRCVSQVPEA